jgi:hypothetical protein
MTRVYAPLLGAALLTLAGAAPASAHALGAEARLKGEYVEVEAYFSDDTPARAARVSVFDEAERTVAEGRTDDAGRWQFLRPAGGTYRVTVDAGAGHRARVTLTIPVEAAAGEAVSEGPSRAEFTRTPWNRVAVGLGAIALAAIVAWAALRGCRCRTDCGPSPNA